MTALDELKAQASEALTQATGVAQADPQTGQPMASEPVKPAPPAPNPEELGEQLVEFCNILTPMAVRVGCMFAKVKFTSQMSGLTTLTKAERDILMMSAPAAAPYVIEMLKKSGQVSVALFIACWGNAVWTKVGECKRIAPKKEVNNGTAEPGTPATDNQPAGAGPATVGKPFKAYGAVAKLYGVPSGAYVQKFNDGTATVVPKPAKK